MAQIHETLTRQIFYSSLQISSYIFSNREQCDFVRSGKKGAMPSAGCAYAKNQI
ncbi:hypothetical protein GXM_09205 [Nostoc sphaeroides CCNUC1]|uniref:Uncharacterized protein n=1 Tax=Nostoc sphaeroides CCNUC1 TaxID=2653204 RepID=A0A5P8WGI7_9NOSO|nr:hypothetical protein GXM_09205 [Nostoc sphaeroides CCNUC1]